MTQLAARRRATGSSSPRRSSASCPGPVTGQSIAAERSGWDDIVLKNRLLDALRRFNPEAVHERHQETRAEELEAVGAGRVVVGQ